MAGSSARGTFGRRDALPVCTVLRDFTVQAVIGHGGFGITYRAGHNELDLTVAIKEYLPVESALREGATVQPRSGTERNDFEEGPCRSLEPKPEPPLRRHSERARPQSE